jgi:hypothetical protein
VKDKDHSDQIDVRGVVVGLYRALLGRNEPTEGEWRSYAEYLLGGGSLEDVVRQMLQSPECQQGFFRNPEFRDLVAPISLPDDIPRLYLWHVPKTGGSSLREMLMRHFSENERCHLTVSELYRLSPARLRSFRFIAGHFGPTLPRFLPGVPLVTVTLIREPLATVTSIYGQLRRHGPIGHQPSDLARKLVFDDWCREEEAHAYWSNPQSRFLALERKVSSWPESHEPAEGEAPPAEESQLRRDALGVLDRIDIVGTTAELLPAYREALHRLDIEPRYSSALRVNVGDMTPELSMSTRDWLQTHNLVDVMLYQSALGRAQQLGA